MKRLKFHRLYQNNSHFRLPYFMQACSQGIIVSKDQFKDNCFERNIRSITSCFDVLSYLCEYLLELLELYQSNWFSFHPYSFYSCILLRLIASLATAHKNHLTVTIRL